MLVFLEPYLTGCPFFVLLTLCSPSSTIGTSARLPSLTFGTDTGAMQNELIPNNCIALMDTIALSWSLV